MGFNELGDRETRVMEQIKVNPDDPLLICWFHNVVINPSNLVNSVRPDITNRS